MADVKQTILDFYQAAQNKDFARDFLFRVVNIDFGDGSDVSFGEEDLVYVRAASMPGREISEVTVPYMGLNFHVPGSVTYPNSEGWELEFYCDEQINLWRKFEQVSRDTFDDQSSTGNYFIPKASSVIDLVQLDQELNRITQYQLVGCSIRNLGDLAYQPAEGTGNVVNFTATIAYHYWQNTFPG